MITPFPQRLNQTEWKGLYRAAILETDKTIIPEKLSETETATLARGRELCYGEGTPEEREALEDALYALCASKAAHHSAGGRGNDLVDDGGMGRPEGGRVNFVVLSDGAVDAERDRLWLAGQVCESQRSLGRSTRMSEV